MITLTGTREQITAISKLPEVRSIYGNRTLNLNSEPEVRALTGVERAWRDKEITTSNNNLPVTGKNVTVAVLDTGVDGNHADLAGRMAKNIKLALVVPGSGLVKEQAEREGLDVIFKAAGFEWREPGCSMCLAMNADKLEPGERCASTSNRNFEGRQGAGGRTHLVSPAMAAAAAVHGHFVDVRRFV